jgi:subtilisin family serine protease
MFKSAILDGRDLSESPFDLTRDISGVVLTFTDRWSGLGGTVQGAGADGATIVVFPTNSEGWTNYGLNPRRLRSARATGVGTFGSKSERGDFSLSSLPPGDYYVAAIPEEDSVRWRDPKVLETLALVATHVTVIEGEHKMVDLRVKDVIR